MRSLLAVAFSCALLQTSNARAKNQNEPRDADRDRGMSKWFNRLTRKDLSRRQGGTCYEDDYYYFVYNSTFGETFCQSYLNYPEVVVFEEYTPTSTIYDVFTTEIVTQSSIVRITPGTTVTVTTTVNNINKRDPQITPMARDLYPAEVDEIFNVFRRQNSMTVSTNSASLAAMSVSFSSACSCQTYSGATVTQTYTNQQEYVTISGYDRTTTTVFSTTTARLTTTETIMLIVTAGAVSSSAPAASVGTTILASSATSSATGPTPTAPPFTCPDDHNTTVSQMVSDERFDYQILCNYDIADPTFYGSLYYPTFGQCVAACSIANKQFEAPVCQGASYFNSVNNEGYNCFLKTTTNDTMPEVGVNSVVLLRIAVGITSNNTAGTTETAPFTSESDSGMMSSVMSSMMGNSTTSMPIITPGPISPAPRSTYYSTYILNGSTYSSGTVFSTYYTSNGSWYYSYYTSYTLNWASQTTEYAISETGTSVSNSSSSTSSQESNLGGGYSIIRDTNTTLFYPGGYNVTEVVSNQTFNANGSQIASTATTIFFSFTDAPRVGNVSVSTSIFSTQTVITNSGNAAGSGGSAASGTIATPPPTPSATAGGGGSAFSSGFFASGALNATGGGGGTAFISGFFASGAITSTATSTAVLVTGGTAFMSGTAASGALSFSDTNTPGGGSGPPAPYGPPITIKSNRTHRPEPIWTPPPYLYTEAPRSGEEDVTTTTATTTTSSGVPLFTGPAYQPFTKSDGGRAGSASTTSSVPLFTGPSYSLFNISGAPRTGSTSTGTGSTPRSTGTAFSPSTSMPLFTGPAYTPFSNSDAHRQGSASITNSCPTAVMGTTTLFSTTTVYGCWSYCAPTGAHHGGGGGPQSFGPPGGW